MRDIGGANGGIQVFAGWDGCLFQQMTFWKESLVHHKTVIVLSSYKAVMGVAYVLICLVVVVPSFALTQR